MLDRSESRGRRCADSLGRRLGSDELGMRRLERLQLAHEGVVRLVRDRRLIEDVVLVVRLLELLPKLGDALLVGGYGHTEIVRDAAVLRSARWRPLRRVHRSRQSPRST